jgi:hypothetical protein
MLSAITIRIITARTCQRRRYEQGTVRNMAMKFDWLKREVNNRLIDPDWLNDLVDMGENNVTPFKMTKCDFAVGLEVNADKTKYVVMARDLNAGRNHNMKIDNSSIERAEEFKYLGTITNQNSIQV